MSPAARAWCSLAVGIICWDILAPPGQTLSEQVDRWLTTRPGLTLTAIATVALHLSNILPVRLDPLHQTFAVLRALNHRSTS